MIGDRKFKPNERHNFKVLVKMSCFFLTAVGRCIGGGYDSAESIKMASAFSDKVADKLTEMADELKEVKE